MAVVVFQTKKKERTVDCRDEIRFSLEGHCFIILIIVVSLMLCFQQKSQEASAFAAVLYTRIKDDDVSF
jgi:hypothetical protein